jgi:hypothetical protein
VERHLGAIDGGAGSAAPLSRDLIGSPPLS